MTKLFLLFFSLIFAMLAPAARAQIQETRGLKKISLTKQIFSDLARARNEAFAVREKYFCLDSKSNKYVQGTITEFDGIQNGTEENWTVIHRITGCQLKQLNYPEKIVNAMNYGWEAYEFVVEGELRKRFDSQKSQDRGKVLNEYYEDTNHDMDAVIEGYKTDGKQCLTRFIPPVCLTREQLQDQRISQDRIVTQKVWPANDDRATRVLNKLASKRPYQNLFRTSGPYFKPKSLVRAGR